MKRTRDVSSMAAIAAAVGMAGGSIIEGDEPTERKPLADYKARSRAIDALRTVRSVPPGTRNAWIGRCERMFPGSIAEHDAKGFRIVAGGGKVLGRGTSLARACKAAVRGAK